MMRSLILIAKEAEIKLISNKAWPIIIIRNRRFCQRGKAQAMKGAIKYMNP